MALKDNPVIYLTYTMWKYSKGNRKNVILYFLMFVMANIVNLLEPLVIAKILNTIQIQGVGAANLNTILFYIFLFVVISIMFWLFHGPARVLAFNNAFLVRANYKKYLLDGTMSLSAQWHTDHHSGDTIDKIEKGTNALYRYSSYIYEVIETIIRFIGSYIALVYFNPHSSYIVLFMIIITLEIIIRFDRKLIRQYIKLNNADNRISAKIYDTISNITTVIILRTENLISRSVFKNIMEPFRLFVKNHRLNEIKWFLVSTCTSLMKFLVLATYIFFSVKSGSTVLVGSIYALYGYVNKINQLFFRFAYRYGEIVRERTAVMNAEEISDEFEKIKVHEIKLIKKDWKELKVENLKFSYHTEEGCDLHLDNVSLSIENGKRIAVIGKSGSGKTTLLKIIRQLYKPTHVDLSVDKRHLENGFQDISSSIALIPQDPEIFSTTIKENITMGVGHSKDEIKKYTDMACFTDVIVRLPKKLESSIVEKGVNLSGGEKQRLALARGLMACKDKSIILLDEPTSSVDSKNEIDIYRNIFYEFGDRTIISSIHRLHLLPMFDMIYFFDDGKVIAEGSF
ncbi:MAG: ATP-binding cassette domain-containing protein, partial [Nanohaloarchaea archaeon]|nr:ATP-binding cassette domain-containing protein [Candidatus Nanohaloarchaea archaeon]